jgi:hypothetical protein
MILIVHLRLNTLTRLDVSRLQGGYIAMQPHLFAVLPFMGTSPVRCTTRIRVTVRAPGFRNLSNCDQTAHCLFGILQLAVQIIDLCWERMDGEKTHRNFRDRWRLWAAACPIFYRIINEKNHRND